MIHTCRALLVRSVWRDSTRVSWWLRVPTAATSWATNPSAWTLRSGTILMPACGSWPARSWTASGGLSAASRTRRSPLASATRRAASVWPPRRPPPATRLHWPLVPEVRSSCGDSGRRSGGTEREYCDIHRSINLREGPFFLLAKKIRSSAMLFIFIDGMQLWIYSIWITFLLAWPFRQWGK